MSSSVSLLPPRAFTLLLLLFLPHTFAISGCEIDCTGHEQGDKIPDPRNCYRYYYCLANGMPTDASVYCPEGAPVFDPSSGECSPSTSCIITCFKDCHSPCNGTLDYVSDPQNCTLYYVCVPSDIDGPYECPLNIPYFDGVNCVNDPTVCCSEDDLCNPLCVTEGAEIPYPFDCRRYYICTGYGPPSDANLFTCPSGEVFDVFLGYCSPGAECKTLCYTEDEEK